MVFEKWLIHLFFEFVFSSKYELWEIAKFWLFEAAISSHEFELEL